MRAAASVLSFAALALVALAAPPQVILFVLVDDLGFGNVGFHAPGNPEVQTPNIDGLVREGVEFSRHYVYQYVCAGAWTGMIVDTHCVSPSAPSACLQNVHPDAVEFYERAAWCACPGT